MNSGPSRRSIFTAVAALLAAATLLARPIMAAPAWETPPGWTDTRGGDGGRVIRVTTLAAGGPGSLAAALAAEGPRVIEFSVAGLIDLGGRSISVMQPRVTIAGETAPSPGITLINAGMDIFTHDVIVRHIRIRPGAGTRAKKSGWEVDALGTGGGAYDVIVDHCSFSWATDENLSASGPRFKGATPDEWRKNTSHRITFSHCIVGECLHDSAHGKGPHSCGSLIHDNATDIAIIGNLYISNNYRNPLFKGGVRGAVINNVIHNTGRSAFTYELEPPEWIGHEWLRGIAVVAGNVARRGPSTTREFPLVEILGPCDVYTADNLYFDATGKALPTAPSLRAAPGMKIGQDPRNEPRVVDTQPFWPPRLKMRPASETVSWVLADAGARPWDRDPVDRRLVEEAKTGGGKIIHYESEVGGHAILGR